MNILITSAGKRVSLVRAFQAELKQAYPAGKVFTTDMCPGLSAACHVSDGAFTVTSVKDAGYINQLKRVCLEQDIRMIVPTIDTELQTLADHKEEFSAIGAAVIVSSPALVNICRDKRKTGMLFTEMGIRIPASIDREDLTYPFFIKPYDGSLSADTHIIRSRNDLRQEYVDNDRLLFMEYFSPEEYDEYTVDMYYDITHHVKCIVPRKRMLVRAGEINKGITSKNGLLSHLREKMEFVEGAVGCLTAQFFLHKTGDEVYGIEINARFGGGYPLSYRAGANYPGWLIGEYFNGTTLPYTENWTDGLLMLRYDDEIIVHGDKYQA